MGVLSVDYHPALETPWLTFRKLDKTFREDLILVPVKVTFFTTVTVMPVIGTSHYFGTGKFSCGRHAARTTSFLTPVMQSASYSLRWQFEPSGGNLNNERRTNNFHNDVINIA